MHSFVTVFVVVFSIAIALMFATLIIGFLKNLKKTRFPQWTFLDYISVGYARHLYLKYVLRK